ncbi:MAG TPA: BlaI/MecI/CopY family transcriptional regulator [Caulobacteraceae bacterium]|jgi:predicted transcriptional regulator|nr:BlaI/MecI/CopY family transcriptional regulator [Caulobacteraceae bacterium]
MQISGAESKIMEALWRRGPLVVDDILAEVAGPQNWSDATVKALIGRLLKKKAIESTRENGRAYYRPLVERDAWVLAESRGLLDKLFGGELTPFVSHFTEKRLLSAQDRERLKALIEKLDDDDR